MFEYQPPVFRFLLEGFSIYYLVFFFTFKRFDIQGRSDLPLLMVIPEMMGACILGSVLVWLFFNPPLVYILAPFVSGMCAYVMCSTLAVVSPTGGGSDMDF